MTLTHPKADDVKALLRDATSPELPESEVQAALSAKSTLASTGLTAAGASLLSTEYLKDTRAELADGSERPLRELSGKISRKSVGGSNESRILAQLCGTCWINGLILNFNFCGHYPMVFRILKWG